MADQHQGSQNLAEVYEYRFVIDGPKKRKVTTCTMCACVVTDALAHAMFHWHRKDTATSGYRYQGRYDTGRLVIKLDHWGREIK